MRLLITMTILFMQWTAPKAFGEEAKAKVDAADLVLQGIADFTLLRDDVVQRYVLMVTGETQQLYDETANRAPLTIKRVYKLLAIDKKSSFRYMASGYMRGPENSYRQFDYQRWVEIYQCGLELRGRNSSVSPAGYKVKEKDQSTKEFIEKNGLEWLQFEPFDDLVLHPMLLVHPMDNHGWTEQVFLQDSKLLSAETIAQDDILSKWRWKLHNWEFEIELTQAKAFEYMPVHVKYTSKIEGKPKLFGETEIKWKKHVGSGRLLPHVIKAAVGAPYGNSEVHHHWVLDWRLGSQIPADFFDCNSADFRLKFSPLYDFDFDTYGPGGLVTGTPWKTPDEILPEDQRSQKAVK